MPQDSQTRSDQSRQSFEENYSLVSDEINYNIFFEGYERIKVVGKGAFGTATLYRRPDGRNVVIKEVNMSDLPPEEKTMALNEVRVLASLDHPNIISYLGSIEYENSLMIEMEYADGGTLAQLISRTAERMPERKILNVFEQVVSAIHYMHQNNVLHRDLKSANIFLNKDSCVKIGDFGISKMMTTRVHAETVLGTPYYMSPEMCDGTSYDEKSDMWGVGCILYEMTSYQKPFMATSLPALIKIIMAGQYTPIPSGYSFELGQLVDSLLQVNPKIRSSAKEVLTVLIPRVYSNLGNEGYEYTEPSPPQTASTVDLSAIDGTRGRSILYQLKSFQSDVSLIPIQLPPTIEIRDVSVSSTHFIVIATDGTVYTWGGNSSGQLGHGDKDSWKHFPQNIEILRSRNIISACAGENFSIFLDDSGTLLTCGDGSYGCLGHGDWDNVLEPKPLRDLDVRLVQCGSHHVVSLTDDNAIYVWGKGDAGALGLGHENNSCTPKRIILPVECIVESIFCGLQCTALVTRTGELLVCGSNTYNKLGIPHTATIDGHRTGDNILTLVPVKQISPHVISVSLGDQHTAVLLQSGYVLTMGRNIEAQLGRKHHMNTIIDMEPSVVPHLTDRFITAVACGPTYTVVVCDQQCITLWGTRYGNSLQNNILEPLKGEYWREPFLSHSNSMEQAQATEPEDMNFGNTTSVFTDYLTAAYLPEVILEPRDVLALYASDSLISSDITLTVGGIYPMSHSILILVHTTVPLSKNALTK